MADNSIDKMKAALKGNGARPNLFRVDITDWPTGVTNPGNDITSVLIKAASLPASIISMIEVPYRGRKLKLAGDRTFEPWNITIINDRDFKIRNAFEKWVSQMSQASENLTVFTGSNALAYMKNMDIHQLDRDGSTILKTYHFVGAFPTNVSPIDVNYETTDTIEEFTVELQYQYWTDAKNNIV